jgi:hypothetical protein
LIVQFFLPWFLHFFSPLWGTKLTASVRSVAREKPYLSHPSKVRASAEQLQLPLSDTSNSSLSQSEGKNLNGEPASGSGVLAAVSLPLAITLLYDGRCQKYSANSRPGAASGLLIRAHLHIGLHSVPRAPACVLSCSPYPSLRGQALSKAVPGSNGDLINRHLCQCRFWADRTPGFSDKLAFPRFPSASFFIPGCPPSRSR